MHRPLQPDDFPDPTVLKRLRGGVRCFSAIESTNAYLLKSADSTPDGSIATAEFQSAGRGRLGRAWLAPRGSSILLSVLLHEPADSRLVPHCATLASLAACEAIDVLTDTHPSVRWPNDLVIGERKVAGVLAESTPLDDGRRAVVIGIGINCLQQPGHFDAELAAKATSLEIESRAAIDRAAIARELVMRLDDRLAGASDGDSLRESRAAWLARCNDRGSPVTLRTRHGMLRGTIVDIDADGGLLVHLDSGERCVFEAATTTRIWEPA